MTYYSAHVFTNIHVSVSLKMAKKQIVRKQLSNYAVSPVSGGAGRQLKLYTSPYAK